MLSTPPFALAKSIMLRQIADRSAPSAMARRMSSGCRYRVSPSDTRSSASAGWSRASKRSGSTVSSTPIARVMTDCRLDVAARSVGRFPARICSSTNEWSSVICAHFLPRNEIGAAVPYVADHGPVAVQAGADERCAHALQRWIAGSGLIDGLVGCPRLHSSVAVREEPASGFGQQNLRRHQLRSGPQGRSPPHRLRIHHSVTDDIQVMIGIESVAVLIVLPHASTSVTAAKSTERVGVGLMCTLPQSGFV